ncbi:MAG: thioredoxin domain-containing protein [Ferruginibacter sp.]
MPNQLIHETSLYLLQHAHNPVNWYPWGDEALLLAKENDRPILVSIGYAACHWCHVMERESFENEETAAVMNSHFINIKIDREERPDLDHIYMDAVQAISGSGGWPLNVFLTPDAKPFYGGTYFPPVKMYNRSSWTDVLLAINDAWKNRRSEVEEQAASLVNHIKNANSVGLKQNLLKETGDDLFTQYDINLVAKNILANADTALGGFGQPPKFLQTFSTSFLLEHAYFHNNREALAHAEFSLQQMISGGIYDHLAGGISRYSTDARWLVPHFEKMLYDNALLLQTLADAYQLTKKAIYKTAILHMVGFLETEMKHAFGGYFAALDADSEGVEGKFYVWEKSEIEEELGNEAAVFCDYYNVTAAGNWEGKNILHTSRPISEIAAKYGLDEYELDQNLSICRSRLLAKRNKRIRPATDDKILLGWNALLITAYCRAGAALQDDKLKSSAVSLFEFIKNSFIAADGSLCHTYKEGKARYPAFADDYACLIQACIHLQEITGNQEYLYNARQYCGFLVDNYSDENGCFFYFTKSGQKDIIVRKTELYDGASPSANALMAQNLYYLSMVFDNIAWRKRSVAMLAALWEAVKKYPSSFANWAIMAQRLAAGTPEIAITGQFFQPVLAELLSFYAPHKLVQSGVDEKMPLLSGKNSSPEDVYIYVCRQYQCLKPVKTAKEAIELLKFNHGKDIFTIIE